MRKREMNVVRTLRRIRDFVAAEATDVSHVYERLLPALDRSLARLDELALEQERGMRLQMAATQRQNVLAEELRYHYVVPLSRVAAELDAEQHGIRAALRAPHKRIPRERLARAARSMADVAARHAPLISAMLGPDFIREMRAAADRLANALRARTTPARRHIAARAVVERELQRARRTVRHMNALLDQALRDSPVRLAVWKRVKRYE